MLQPYLNLSTLSQSSFQRHLTPTSEPKPEINYKTLLRWLSNMQGSEVEIGGFKGRTNKLVDGCYSWWVGGSFGLLEAVGVGGHGEPQGLHDDGPASAQDTENWDDVDGAADWAPMNPLAH
jgi:protein farnesyltransferase subunit beta